MAALLFFPRTTIDANLLQYRLNHSEIKYRWNLETGAYEFNTSKENINQLEDELSWSLTYDLDGYFQIK